MTRESMPKPNIEDKEREAMGHVADATLPKVERGVKRPRGDKRPWGQATKGWRKPTAEELNLNPNMLLDVDIPATPPSLMSNELQILPTPNAEKVIKK